MDYLFCGFALGFTSVAIGVILGHEFATESKKRSIKSVKSNTSNFIRDFIITERSH